MTRCINVLVVGQTPPPFHGQAMIMERLLRGNFQRVRLHHVRMAFSRDIAEVGHFRWRKLWHLLSVIVRMVFYRVVHRPEILYYPPAGPNRVPLYRDLAILLCTRWMFRATIFRFDASGISELYPTLPRFVRMLFRRAFFYPQAVMRITCAGPADAALLQPRREFVVPNGIDDEFRNDALPDSTRAESKRLRILFVGILCESKGLMLLIDACGRLAARGLPWELTVAGQFQSADFEAQVRDRISALRLESQVKFLGVVHGEAKWEAFRRADVLCLPSHYESETFPGVLLEAMSFELPVVATRWRGIPEIVDDGVTGFLVATHDAPAIANCLEQLQADRALRRRFGEAGRKKFLGQFTTERFWRQTEDLLVQTAEMS